jgi:hypothetical protein
MRHFLLGIVLLVCGAVSVDAATYFVDYSGGSNANAGTSSSSPWKHCPGDPAANGVPASRALAAGDTVIFKGGVTYVFTGATGIALNWSGAAGSPITYDGNSAGAWGSGRARFSDNHGANGITAFTAATLRRHLSFKNLELGPIGGSATLPPDPGQALAPRFGGGIAFLGGAEGVLIDRCVFRQLGFWFNQRPMGAGSIAGTGILLSTATNVTISNCDFSQMAIGCEVKSTTGLQGVQIKSCSFGDSMVWPVNLPAGVGSLLGNLISLVSCTFSTDGKLDAGWSGYAHSPRVDTGTVQVGASVTFVASATADPAATFQWRKNGVPISGATSISLTLPSVTLLDAGTYTALASNSGGSTLSNAAVLVVEGGALPMIQTPLPPVNPPANPMAVVGLEPQVQLAAAGSSVTLVGAATGSPLPSYQWRRNGVPIPGATGTTLALVNVSAADAAAYTFVATNAAGSATSAQTVLTVQPPAVQLVAPAITLQPVSRTADAGTSVTFAAAASGSSPALQWRKNGSPIADATGTTLTLRSISANDAGSYTFSASNSAGTATSNAATLTVNTGMPPVIASHPVSQSRTSGTSVDFVVAASGTPAPAFQWRKNGVSLPGATAATLRLHSLTTNDEATYTVVVSNRLGSVTSKPATLTIQAPPQITLQPVSQSASAGSNVKFIVGATGRPAPTYQWLRNGVPIAGATAATLSLVEAMPEAAGAYSVVVRNAAGSVVSSPAQLTVTAPVYGEFRVGGGSAAKELYISQNLTRDTDALEVTLVVQGSTAQKILVRAIGPSLGAFGMGSVLADPRIAIYSGTTVLHTNDNWKWTSMLMAVTQQVGAFPLPNPGTKDAVVIAELPPGAYRVRVTSADDGTGTVLLQLFHVP